MIGQFVDTMPDFGVNWYRMVIMTHQTLRLEKYWKLPPATLIPQILNQNLEQEKLIEDINSRK